MKQIILLLTIAIAFTTNGFGQKKTVKPVKKTTVVVGSQFFMTIEHNGEKTEIRNTQFQTADGMTYAEGAQNGRTILFYGASNNKDDKNFTFQSWIATPAIGTYNIGDKAGFSLMTSLFSNVPIFLPKSGTITITAMPLKGGFVEGTFEIVCENVTDAGKIEIYNVSGSFKLKRT